MAQNTDQTNELLNEAGFPQLKDWVIQRTGLAYYLDKDSDFAAAVCRAFALPKLLPVETMLARLEAPESREMDRVVEELTIGETFFFRHVEMFHALRDHAFRELLQRKEARVLRIWSAGCSVGAEPYSLAIMLREQFSGMFKDWAIQIVGTDINRRFLSIAESGIYDPWALRGVSRELEERCFEQRGKKLVLREQCRRNVRFRYHNLASDPFPSALHDMYGFDLIICRNVMIYFDGVTIRRLADQFYRSLLPGGWLAVGHAEPHTDIFTAFRTINAPGAVLYQRPLLKEEPLDIPRMTPVFQPAQVNPTPVARFRRRVIEPSPPVAARGAATPAGAPPDRVEAPREPDLELPPQTLAEAFPRDSLANVRSLANAGKLDDARELCESLISREPLDPALHLYQGMVLLQMGFWPEADQALRRCIYLKRDLAVAHYYLGLVQENLGRNCERCYRNAMELLREREGTSVVELGEGLTVGELLGLINAHLPQETT